MAVKCRKYGVEKVFVSSVIVCKRLDHNRILLFNKQLEEKCNENDISFINHWNIDQTHLWKDGLHLSDTGKNILARNFIFYINDFLMKCNFAPGLA